MQNNLPPWYALPKADIPRSVAIIGGGLAGLSCAYALVKRGLSVSIYEAATNIASHASGNHAGMLMPQIVASPNLESLFYEQGFSFAHDCLAMLANQGLKVEADLSGLLYLSANQQLENRIHRYREKHFSLNHYPFVDVNDASKLAGVPLSVGGLHLKNAGWVSVPSLCKNLQIACAEKLRLFCNTRILNIVRLNQAWHLQTSMNEMLKADAVIIANAMAAKQFEMCKELPLFRSPGQLNLISENAFSRKLKTTLCGECYFLPSIDGKHVLGASFRGQDAGHRISTQDYQGNLTDLAHISPQLTEAIHLQPWQGKVSDRATTIDHLPLVGPLPEREGFFKDYERMRHGDKRADYPDVEYLPNLYVSLGFGARGLSACLLAGEIIACLMHQSTLPVDEKIYQALHPARFYLRSLKRQ